MDWWARRSTWQKVVLIVLGLLVAVNTAAALVATTSQTEAQNGTNSSTPQVTSSTNGTATTTSTTSPADTTSTTSGTTTTVAPTSTSTTVVQPPGTDLVTLASVTDGDTVRVQFVDGTVEKVRLIGINTPETGECFADEATAAITSLLKGQTFTMTSDTSDRDQYDRLLRYLWLDDGTFVNESLVINGFAIARDYPPDSEYADRLARAQEAASIDGLGIWAPEACGPASGANLKITRIEFDAPGNDNDNLNGEWVEIENVGSTAVTMTSWVLKDESAVHRY
ncbi:MAG: thermonuclease family protein, partial [Acidimicrobiia bacterium]